MAQLAKAHALSISICTVCVGGDLRLAEEAEQTTIIVYHLTTIQLDFSVLPEW